MNLNGLSFCILNRTSNTIEFLKTTAFGQKLNPFDVLNRLKTELSSSTSFSEDFDSVTVIHQNELATLVPNALYNENNKADYLKFNSKILKTDLIAHDDIVINDSSNVYVPYVNINNYIFETFGEFVYKHASSVLIDSILQNNRRDETTVNVNVNDNTLEVIVSEKKSLMLFNSFEYNSKEDFIYYILFVFEQLNLNVETTFVYLSGNISKEDGLYDIIYTYVRHIYFVENFLAYNLESTISNNAYKTHYLILNSF
ncbi:hypothetical protein WPG_2934 [Winogradskyella sp. PG-2]|nr:hypothetical protein WPG_2934 [Winogradskyella sp. PG-2]